MKNVFLIPLVFLCLTASGAPRMTGNAQAMTDALRTSDVVNRVFDVTGTVTCVSTNRANEHTNVLLQDETGSALCRAESRQWPNRTMPVCGARARLQGYFETTARGPSFAVLTNYTELARGPEPSPIQLSLAALSNGRHYFTYCLRSGILRDVIFSESDPDWLLLSICSAEGSILASVPITEEQHRTNLVSHIGCEVSAPGYFVPYDHGPHGQFGCKFKIAGTDQIRIVETEGAPDELSVAFDDYNIARGSDVIALGRRYVKGWIVAAWQRNEALLRTEDGDHIFLSLAQNEALPRYGEYVMAVGLPVTDLYRVSLLNANMVPMPGAELETEEIETQANALLSRTPDGRSRLNYSCQGRLVAISGRVDAPDEKGRCRLSVEGMDDPIMIDASFNPDLLSSIHSACIVSVTGVCIPDVIAPHQNGQYNRLGGVRIIPRTSSDITILKKPSWLTLVPWYLVSIVLAAVLLLIGIWNLALRRIAEKRGQELAGETIARATSDLKVYERTRLAVELHDSLAQTLTGIALELATAEVTDDSDPKMIKQHLGIAARALKSCRMELRNSLWDLRHETLENDDMEATILKTIQPHRGKADVSVRFSVPRDRISDNTAHAILRIIRELTVNAIRHGQATAIRIAGAVEGDRLKFSVKDNGCGFDPDNCPNDEQGHYGLLGIRERINTFEGQLKIESAPGQGTKATIEIKMPREQ